MIDRIVNVSEKNKCFVWTPAKTASVTASIIFNLYNFSLYKINEEKLLFLKDGFFHHHQCEFFPSQSEYDFILTVRNPYSTLVSRCYPNNGTDLKIVQKTIENTIFSKIFFSFQQKLKQRKPTYIVRVENILDDYNKIPFIYNSNYRHDGVLIKLLEKKTNASEKGINWKKFYSKDLADLVYYNLVEYFDMFEYDKNSWKNEEI